MARGNWMGAALAAALLTGCSSGLPPAASVEPAPVPGVALPFKARVMIYAGENDLKRKMSIQLSRYQDEETKVQDGHLLTEAAQAMLSKGFAQVGVNDPAMRPQIVVRLVGKVAWAKVDSELKMGCGIEAWTADGNYLGNFVARWNSPMKTDYRVDVGPGYAQCLKKPMDEFLASPTLARLAGRGFPDPHPKAAEEWLRSLGPIAPWP
jgi:hypothetical protein